jgi:hypothetical protein
LGWIAGLSCDAPRFDRVSLDVVEAAFTKRDTGEHAKRVDVRWSVTARCRGRDGLAREPFGSGIVAPVKRPEHFFTGHADRR